MPLAASLSTLGVFILRCLHPLAAAVALIVVLGNVMHYRFAFFPVMIDFILLASVGAVYSNLTGKATPTGQITLYKQGFRLFPLSCGNRSCTVFDAVLTPF
jgi:CBS-domain-containing membrane protein